MSYPYLKFKFHKILILGFSSNTEKYIFSSSHMCNYFILLYCFYKLPFILIGKE